MTHPHDTDPEAQEPPGDSDEAERERGFLSEFVRKMAVAGLGALFMTEEGIRNLSGQLKLPKEALQFILAQAEKTKDDVSRVVTEEVRRFLQQEKLREEFLRLLTGMTVEIKAEVRLIPSSQKADEATPMKLSVTDLTVRRGRRKRE
jgi:hypothetical protein